MKKMKITFWMILAWVSIGTSSFANDSVKGGGEVPFPLGQESFELASGEKYNLFGTLWVYDNQVFFEPDFQEMPWLANDQRIRWGVYPVIGRAQAFRKFHNQKVYWKVKASGLITRNANTGESGYEIYLESVDTPARAKIDR